MTAPHDDGLSMAFNFHDGDYGADFGGGVQMGNALEDDMADTESNGDLDGEYEVDDEDPNLWQDRGGFTNVNDSGYGVGATGHNTSTNDSPTLDSQSQGSEQGHKRTRKSGDPMAEQRTISADLDSTDEMIVNMKDGGYSNEQVSQALVKDGRIHYDKKTVGSRYLRLKSAIAERTEQRLDDELTDWHEGEDEALIKADQLALAEIADTIVKIKAKRWTYVSRNLHKILKKEYKYSPNSCQKRFIALQNGTATIPPELCDNPNQRAEEKAARTLAKIHEKNLLHATAKEVKENKRLLVDQERLRKALEKKARADERARTAQKQAYNAQEQAVKRDQKARELIAERQAQEERIALLRSGNGISSGRTPSAGLQKRPSLPNIGLVTPASTISTPSTNGKITRDRTIDPNTPRGRMTMVELEAICARRGLIKNGSKAVLLKRISDDDAKLSVNELRGMLRAHGAPTEGDKDALIARVVQVDCSYSAWGRKHSSSLNNFWERASANRDSPDADAADDSPLINGKRGASDDRNGIDPKRIRSGQYIDSNPNSPSLLMGLADVAANTAAMESRNGSRAASLVPQVSAPATHLAPPAEAFDTVDADVDIQASIESDHQEAFAV
ncbi:hypothetical protein EJ08DRAFT_678518 [Tothia fuscella]|uniref:SAP domain-containing protein n=1 Tax=Tothia fuscella TaxID=1048955 RepID=A0A9P4NT94_9PEZI|nr:hypothetical protein EJ08DRAFT_678518 [Tothia fuscella]